MTVLECINHPKVKRSIRQYSMMLARRFPRTFDFEDAQSVMHEGIIKKFDKYDPKRSGITTFIHQVLKTTLYNTVKTETYHKRVAHHYSSSWDEDNLESPADFENEILMKVCLDDIEDNLSGRHQEVFAMMRKGASMSGCGEMLGLSRSRVSQICKNIRDGLNKDVLV